MQLIEHTATDCRRPTIALSKAQCTGVGRAGVQFYCISCINLHPCSSTPHRSAYVRPATRLIPIYTLYAIAGRCYSNIDYSEFYLNHDLNILGISVATAYNLYHPRTL